MTPKIRRITVTEAARNFADAVNRAFYRQETTVLVKNGVPVAHIAPASPSGTSAKEALARWRLIPRLGASEADDMLRDLKKSRAALPAVRSPWD